MPQMALPNTQEVISGQSIPEAFHTIDRERLSGRLTVKDHGCMRSVSFAEGRAMTATSDHRDDSLTRLLVNEGAVPLRMLSYAIERSLRQHRLLGEILVEEGAMTRAQVDARLCLQFRRIIERMLRSATGEMGFTETGPKRPEVRLDVSADNLLVETLRNQTFWARVIERVGGLNKTYRLLPGAETRLDALPFSTDERHLFEACETPLSLLELCEMPSLGEYATCRTVWTGTLIEVLAEA